MMKDTDGGRMAETHRAGHEGAGVFSRGPLSSHPTCPPSWRVPEPHTIGGYLDFPMEM